MQQLTDWFRRQFADPQIVFLILFLFISFGIVLTMGNMLMPVLAGIVIAYLLQGLVGFLERRGFAHIIAVVLVFTGFMLFLVILVGVRLVFEHQYQVYPKYYQRTIAEYLFRADMQFVDDLDNSSLPTALQ